VIIAIMEVAAPVIMPANKFKASKARELIAEVQMGYVSACRHESKHTLPLDIYKCHRMQVLKAKLAGTVYNADQSSTLSREIADDIKVKLKGAENRSTGMQLPQAGSLCLSAANKHSRLLHCCCIHV
jgi:hypothetical protein